VDSRQHIVLFNQAAEKMFGTTAPEALGQSLGRFIPERHRAAHVRHVSQFGETGVSSRSMGRLGALLGLRASGEEFPIEASISQVEIQGEKLFTVILRDITERKRIEDESRRHAEELAAANEELTRFNEAMVGRELRMVELKQEVNALRAQLGQPPPYSSELDHEPKLPPV